MHIAKLNSISPISNEDTNALPIKELDPAIAFYRSVLGFTLTRRDTTTATLERDGVRVRLVINHDHQPGEAGSLAFAVDDLDGLHRELSESGGKPGEFGIDEWDGKRHRTFFVREEENGYCYCFYCLLETSQRDNNTINEVVQGLLAGDFTRLDPLFESPADGTPIPIMRWVEDGSFDDEEQALAEAFTCACFNDRLIVVEYLLAKGVNPNGGIVTGMNAFHWAVNRGNLQVVKVLVEHKADLESINSYGGTILSCAVWSKIHEPKRDHLKIVEVLLNAGAHVGDSLHPSGDDSIDAVLIRYISREQR